jgi:hypothetical protein
MYVTHIASEDNVADILTKPLPGGTKWDSLVSRVLHDIINKLMPLVQGMHDTAVKLLSSLPRLPLARYN